MTYQDDFTLPTEKFERMASSRNHSQLVGGYRILSDSDVKDQIMALGEKISTGEIDKTDDLISMLEQLLANLKTKKGS